MKLLFIRSNVLSKMLVVLFLITAFYGCQKADHWPGHPDHHGKPKPSPESADFVYEWYKSLAEMQLPEVPASALVGYRNFAYIGVGLFESVQPGIKGASSFSSKLYQMPAMPKPDKSKDYLWSASANAAMARMAKLFLTNLTDANKASIDMIEATNYNSFKSMASNSVLERSQAFGRAVADAIYNWSTTDNFTVASNDWQQSDLPGAWVPTGNPPTVYGAHVGESRPMLRYTLNALAPPLPFPYSTDPNSAFYKAAKEVYEIGKSENSAQQASARWWADAGGQGLGYPAPYHLVSIVTTVLEDHNAGLWKAAEVYAKTGIGMKDGPIITFRSKFFYNLLRPVTYIRQNIDANWNSLIPSPPYPEYTSGLVSNYGPVIQVLIRHFGDVPITDDLYTWRNLPERRYRSLSKLLEDVAYSRIYAGIHYRFTQDVTIAMGVKLGNEIEKIRVVGPEYK